MRLVQANFISVHEEVAMAILRRIMIALLTVATFATGVAEAASTTNFSDQWWVESESGWGASVLQQADVLFIDLFVYGADNKPTWFTAAVSNQSSPPTGHTLFTGDLYQTSGPYYGGTFNPAAVTRAKIGTLTFDANSTNTATLTYTVSGVQVVKNITRQTWRNENLGASYYGGESGDEFCNFGGANGHYELQDSFQFTHNPDDSIIAVVTDQHGHVMTLTGTYSQSGHMGKIAGTVVSSGYPAGDNYTGSANLFEIERTISGITGRWHLYLSGLNGVWTCRIDGRWGGVQR
jgi:hypothetical protein